MKPLMGEQKVQGRIDQPGCWMCRDKVIYFFLRAKNPPPIKKQSDFFSRAPKKERSEYKQQSSGPQNLSELTSPPGNPTLTIHQPSHCIETAWPHGWKKKCVFKIIQTSSRCQNTSSTSPLRRSAMKRDGCGEGEAVRRLTCRGQREFSWEGTTRSEWIHISDQLTTYYIKIT